MQILGNQNIHFNESLNKHCLSKIVKRVVSHIIFTSYARNVHLQSERKRENAGTITAWFRSAHSFLVPRFSFQFVDIRDLGTIDSLLSTLHDIRAASGSEFFVFQQDSAPSHCTKDNSSTAGARDAHPRSGRLTRRTSIRLTIARGV